jgi:hypothetical protein
MFTAPEPPMMFPSAHLYLDLCSVYVVMPDRSHPLLRLSNGESLQTMLPVTCGEFCLTEYLLIIHLPHMKSKKRAPGFWLTSLQHTCTHQT